MSRKHGDTDEEMIRAALGEGLGLDVRTIAPSAHHKSPDLLINLADARILVEVERKAGDKQLRKLLDREPGATLQYSGDRTAERIKNAWRQIRDYRDRRPSDATLIWLIAGQRDATLLTDKAAITRLYGLERLEGHTETGEYYSRPCYFFHESLFFRHKELDAVVVHSHDNLLLCLNPYSPRCVAWRGYPFLSSFSIIDPAAEESAGLAFLADCAEDRSETKSIVRYLRQKYKLRAPTITRFVLVNVPVDP